VPGKADEVEAPKGPGIEIITRKRFTGASDVEYFVKCKEKAYIHCGWVQCRSFVGSKGYTSCASKNDVGTAVRVNLPVTRLVGYTAPHCLGQPCNAARSATRTRPEMPPTGNASTASSNGFIMSPCGGCGRRTTIEQTRSHSHGRARRVACGADRAEIAQVATILERATVRPGLDGWQSSVLRRGFLVLFPFGPNIRTLRKFLTTSHTESPQFTPRQHGSDPTYLCHLRKVLGGDAVRQHERSNAVRSVLVYILMGSRPYVLRISFNSATAPAGGHTTIGVTEASSTPAVSIASSIRLTRSRLK
jgi:hypothetical protein